MTSLRSGYLISNLISCIHSKLLENTWKKKKNLFGIRETNTLFEMDIIFPLRDYTGEFGRITLGKFQRDTTFITGMGMGLIIESKISNVLIKNLITRCILTGKSGKRFYILLRLKRGLISGIGLKKVGSVIVELQEKCGITGGAFRYAA